MKNWPPCLSPLNFSFSICNLFFAFKLFFIGMIYILSEFCYLAISHSEIMNFLAVFHPIKLLYIYYLSFSSLLSFIISWKWPEGEDGSLNVDFLGRRHLRSLPFSWQDQAREHLWFYLLASISLLHQHQNSALKELPFPCWNQRKYSMVASHCLSLNPSYATRLSVQTWAGNSNSLWLSFLILIVPAS